MIPGGSSGGQLPRRNDLTLVLILDELLHGFRVEDFDVLHDRRIGFAALLHGDDVHVRRRIVFRDDLILLREVRGKGVARIDHGSGCVVKRTGQLRGLDFDDLDLLHVLRDISLRHLGGGDIGLQFNPALLREELKRAAAVRRIVRNSDRRAVLDLGGALDLLRVEGER